MFVAARFDEHNHRPADHRQLIGFDPEAVCVVAARLRDALQIEQRESGPFAFGLLRVGGQIEEPDQNLGLGDVRPEAVAHQRGEGRRAAREVEALLDDVLVAQVFHRQRRPVDAQPGTADADLRRQPGGGQGDGAPRDGDEEKGAQEWRHATGEDRPSHHPRDRVALRPCRALKRDRGRGSTRRGRRDEDRPVAVRDAQAVIRRRHLHPVAAAPRVRPVVLGLDVPGQVELAVLDRDEVDVLPLHGLELGRRHRGRRDALQRGERGWSALSGLGRVL